MGIREAEAGMLSLESISCSFDYGKAQFYREKIQAYVDLKHDLYPEQPALLDVSFGRTKLPPSLKERIDVWMEVHPEYSPYMRTFATHYLVSLLDDDCDGSPYNFLVECVKEGGHFYLETGMFYILDAAAVSTLVRQV